MPPTEEVVEVPDLDVDRHFKERYGEDLSDHAKAERREVARVIDRLAKHGWRPQAVEDGLAGDNHTEATDKKAVMEQVFNLDDSRVHFAKTLPDGSEASHWCLFIRGNAPDEVLSNYSFARTPKPGDDFGTVLDAMVEETVAAWSAKGKETAEPGDPHGLEDEKTLGGEG